MAKTLILLFYPIGVFVGFCNYPLQYMERIGTDLGRLERRSMLGRYSKIFSKATPLDPFIKIVVSEKSCKSNQALVSILSGK